MKSTGRFRIATITLVCLFLVGITVSVVDAQEVNGRNAVEVVYGNGTTVSGTFRKGSDGVWKQMDASGNVVASFNETNRDDWTIYLAGTSGSSSATLNLWQKEVNLNSGGASTLLGKVISASDKVTGTAAQQINQGTEVKGANVTLVEYNSGAPVPEAGPGNATKLEVRIEVGGNPGSVIFQNSDPRAQNNKTWFMRDNTGRSAFCNESRRTASSIFLSCSEPLIAGNNWPFIELNLQKKEVIYGGRVGVVLAATDLLAEAKSKGTIRNANWQDSANKIWFQEDAAGKQNCNETNRDEWSVYLACPGGDAVINLFRKEFSIGSNPAVPIVRAEDQLAEYRAREAQKPQTATRSAPAVTANGTNAAEVTLGNNSIFRKISERGWLQIDPANQVVANCVETGRDEWNVNLDCPFKQTKIVINLSQKKVTSRAQDGAETVLGNVVSASDKLPQSATRSASTTGAEALKSPLSPDDLEAVMTWIANEVSNARTPYCYKNTYGRGEGTGLNQCSPGLAAEGGLCYTPCRSGFGPVATSCYKSCPAGFRDDGLYCGKPAAYTRPGYPWQPGDPLLPDYSGPIGRCEAANGSGKCEQVGAIIYPKCKEGFRNIGSDVCSPVCPAGMSDIGVSCAKDSYDRGIGKPMICGSGLEQSGLLCYPACRSGFEGRGPVCWQQCNGAQKVQCGVGCADSQDTCASVTSDMVLAPINMVVSLATMGLSSAATSGANAAAGGISKLAMGSTTKWNSLIKAVEKVTEVVDGVTYAAGIIQDLKDEVDRWTDDYEGNFAEATSPAINARIDAEFGPTGARYIKRAWAKHQLTAFLEADGWRIAKFALSIASIEPSGIVSVINAYAHPMCKATTPNATPATRTDGTNVATVTYRSGSKVGSLRISNDKAWRWQPLENNQSFRQFGLTCSETSRDQWSVYLTCGPTSTRVTANLSTGKVTARASNGGQESAVGDIIRTGNDSGFNPWPNVKLLYR